MLFLFLGLAGLIIYFGLEILNRLPKPKQHRDFAFQSCDHMVLIRIDNVMEQDFNIEFVNGWAVGRSFSIWGKVLPLDDVVDGAPDFRERTGINIHPSPDWFQQSQIGYVRSFESGGCESHIVLPYQIAHQLLDDIRRNPKQLAAVGFKKVVTDDGKVDYQIFSFELSEDLT